VFENHPIDQALREWRDDSLKFGEINNSGLTNFPMDLMVTLEDGLVIEYMFLREHFDLATVEGIRSNMEGLLTALVQDAGQALDASVCRPGTSRLRRTLSRKRRPRWCISALPGGLRSGPNKPP
jgi:hypothetical protein